VATYVLVLATLNSDYTDATRHQYPREGIVKAENFVYNRNIFQGLHGVLWGWTHGGWLYLKDGLHSVWAVVQVDSSKNFIIIDETHNIVKFESGLVVCHGGQEDCASFIKDYREKNNIKDCVNEEFIMGYVSRALFPNAHALSGSYLGGAISDIEGLHAISSGLKGKALTHGDSSHAFSLSDNSRSVALKDDCHALSLGKNSRAITCGARSQSIVMGEGSKAISTGFYSTSICLAPNCEASAGVGGKIIMMYQDGEKQVFRIGKVGDEIIANRSYYCNEDGKFVLIGSTEGEE
tara:strand:- start:33 stop:911 length:879 start_codon:yes stop_codon:yes gene_type:complete